jgi:hypothetical protein
VDARKRTGALRSVDGTLICHILVIIAVSSGFESLFIHHGINVMDEGWPLYAAMQMMSGKTLYQEIFWVFPPGHALAAWIAYALDPPGLILARIIYAIFNVALCVGIYLLSRRVMPPGFALFAGLLLAVGAPRSHGFHLLFGYRYLIWSLIALLLFDRRLRTGNPRWLFAAGVFAGIALFFRLTPAFAVSCAIGVSVMAASRDWRRWLEDWLGYGAGLLLIVAPILLWFGLTVGLEKLWLEAVVRPVVMTDLQFMPMRELDIPELTRKAISATFVSVQFRLYPLVYAGFALVLAYRWLKAVRGGHPFEHVLLLAIVIWGAIFFTRSLGRSDQPHLDSTLPPTVVLLAYLASLSSRVGPFRYVAGSTARAAARAAFCAVLLVIWVLLFRSDEYFDADSLMGASPLTCVDGVTAVRKWSRWRTLDHLVPRIKELSEPGQTILAMTHAPLLYVLTGRSGPGHHDVIMPGTFLGENEERVFLERLKAAPPAVVVWPRRHFDGFPSRGIRYTAPLVGRWVQENYRPISLPKRHQRLYALLVRN